uniref:Uncharacterized protein n=1 Tax=Neolamprologus brichardi TaxID=32507 RepID=A0A3Q4GPI3_NEOBR
MQSAAPASKVCNASRPSCFDAGPFTLDCRGDSYYLEPLLPAIPKMAKEKSISLNKQEESGESRCRGTGNARNATAGVPQTSQRKSPSTCTPMQVVESVPSSLRQLIEDSAVDSQPGKKQSEGFFLHLAECSSSAFGPECVYSFDYALNLLTTKQMFFEGEGGYLCCCYSGKQNNVVFTLREIVLIFISNLKQLKHCIKSDLKGILRK